MNDENKIDLHKNKILLVTGNGFDLQCDLRSKYADYFRYLRKTNYGAKDPRFSEFLYKLDYENLYRILATSPTVSIWEFYLAVKLKNYKEDDYDIDWFDIEQEIEKSLKKGEFWDQVYKYMITDYRATPPPLYNDIAVVARAMIIRWGTTLSDPNNKNGEQLYYTDLLKELNKLETNFGKYLQKIALKRYVSVRDENIQKIIDRFEGIADYKILTFNYTSVESSKFKIHYVHGNLNHPIFGICKSSRTDIKLNDFTKTHRRVDKNINLEKYADLLRDIDEDYALVFYGVSFNEIDLEDYKRLINKCKTVCVLYSNYDFATNRCDSIRDSFENLYLMINSNKDNQDFDSAIDDEEIFIENIEFDK